MLRPSVTLTIALLLALCGAVPALARPAKPVTVVPPVLQDEAPTPDVPVADVPTGPLGPTTVITPAADPAAATQDLATRQWRLEIILDRTRRQLDADKLDGAVESCRRALALRIFDARLQSVLGETYLRLGNYDQATTALRLATGSTRDKSLLCDALSGLGWERFEADKTDDADALWQEAREADPLSGRPYAALAFAALRRSDAPAALASARRATVTEPDWSGAWCALGVVLYATGDPAAAEQAQRKALELAPLDPSALSNLAFILFDREDFAGALALWRQAADKDASDPDIRAGLAIGAWRTGDDRSARAWYRHAATLDPTYLNPNALASTRFWSAPAIAAAHEVVASIQAAHTEPPPSK